jgi:isopropylmalate/homocitrate/citramalate synthase
MIELREPLHELAKPPRTWTGGKRFRDPRDIKIYDDTLRDGEQMPGVAFSPEQKLELAVLLSEIGVHVMDVAFPVVSESDRRSLQLCVKAQRAGRIREDVELLAMCRSNPGDVDAVVETLKAIGAPPHAVAVLVLSTLSDLHMKYKIGQFLLKREGRDPREWLDLPVEFYRQANIKMITAAIRYARERGFRRVEFAAEDASRSDLAYDLTWAKACVDAGGTRMCFSDTCGVFTPEAVDHYIPPLVAALPKDVELTAHFHNDFGIGAYNCVRALSHGATHAGVTANGIGERAGNAPLHQVVMQLKELYGIELPGFRYDRLWELRRAVERASGIPLPPHEPIIGEGVFSHESGMHTAGIAIHPAIYQFIREGDVGGEHRFVFGKHSGAAAVEHVLAKHAGALEAAGVKVTDDLVKRLVARVKELRERRLRAGAHARFVDEYYANYFSLGISEAELLALATGESAMG